MQLSDLSAVCRKLGCETEENAPMTLYTSFRIGGPADLLVTAPNAREACEVWKLCKEHKVPVMFLGNGTNILVSDTGIRGVVLRLNGHDAQPKIEDGVLVCSAGVTVKRLCLYARNHGLSGLEFAYGIPGTVGGAAFMNAGAYGGQMSDVLVWADALFSDGEVRRVTCDQMRMGYRHSVFMDSGAVITAAAFRLTPDQQREIGVRMDDCMRRRREKQPLEYPSAGSFFKRPPGHFAGALIENSGLKGCRVGGAQVSEKHAGFIINRGGATCTDVKRLMKKVKECVLKDHGVELEPEVRFIGED